MNKSDWSYSSLFDALYPSTNSDIVGVPSKPGMRNISVTQIILSYKVLCEKSFFSSVKSILYVLK